MTKKQVLDEYLKQHKVPDIILTKVNISSFLTENFAYSALRIGNSIGDLLDISIEILLLDEIAKKFGLILNTTEHAELHTKGTTDKDLDTLLKGAIVFENIKNNKKNYKEILKKITDFIRVELTAII